MRTRCVQPYGALLTITVIIDEHHHTNIDIPYRLLIDVQQVHGQHRLQ